MEEPARKRLRVFQHVPFKQRLKQVSINPLHRSDFLGDLLEYRSGSRSNEDYWVVRGNAGSEDDDDEDEALGALGSAAAGPAFAGPGSAGASLTEKELGRLVYDQLRATFFSSALRYWRRRNATADFKSMARKLLATTESLPELLLHLEDIVTAVLALLASPDAAAREPAYHLPIALARDAQGDLVPFLPRILASLVDGLDARILISLEGTFHCIAGLFAQLSREILARDTLPEMLPSLIQLFLHNSVEVRQFAQEAVAVLVRRTSPESMLGVVDAATRRLRAAELKLDPQAIGDFLFELVTNVERSFTVRFDVVARYVLDEILPSDGSLIAAAFFSRCIAHMGTFDRVAPYNVQDRLFAAFERAGPLEAKMAVASVVCEALCVRDVGHGDGFFLWAAESLQRLLAPLFQKSGAWDLVDVANFSTHFIGKLAAVEPAFLTRECAVVDGKLLVGSFPVEECLAAAAAAASHDQTPIFASNLLSIARASRCPAIFIERTLLTLLMLPVATGTAPVLSNVLSIFAFSSHTSELSKETWAAVFPFTRSALDRACSGADADPHDLKLICLGARIARRAGEADNAAFRRAAEWSFAAYGRALESSDWARSSSASLMCRVLNETGCALNSVRRLGPAESGLKLCAGVGFRQLVETVSSSLQTSPSNLLMISSDIVERWTDYYLQVCCTSVLVPLICLAFDRTSGCGEVPADATFCRALAAIVAAVLSSDVLPNGTKSVFVRSFSKVILADHALWSGALDSRGCWCCAGGTAPAEVVSKVVASAASLIACTDDFAGEKDKVRAIQDFSRDLVACPSPSFLHAFAVMVLSSQARVRFLPVRRAARMALAELLAVKFEDQEGSGPGPVLISQTVSLMLFGRAKAHYREQRAASASQETLAEGAAGGTAAGQSASVSSVSPRWKLNLAPCECCEDLLEGLNRPLSTPRDFLDDACPDVFEVLRLVVEMAEPARIRSGALLTPAVSCFLLRFCINAIKHCVRASSVRADPALSGERDLDRFRTASPDYAGDAQIVDDFLSLGVLLPGGLFERWPETRLLNANLCQLIAYDVLRASNWPGKSLEPTAVQYLMLHAHHEVRRALQPNKRMLLHIAASDVALQNCCTKIVFGAAEEHLVQWAFQSMPSHPKHCSALELLVTLLFAKAESRHLKKTAATLHQFWGRLPPDAVPGPLVLAAIFAHVLRVEDATVHQRALAAWFRSNAFRSSDGAQFSSESRSGETENSARENAFARENAVAACFGVGSAVRADSERRGFTAACVVAGKHLDQLSRSARSLLLAHAPVVVAAIVLLLESLESLESSRSNRSTLAQEELWAAAERCLALAELEEDLIDVWKQAFPPASWFHRAVLARFCAGRSKILVQWSATPALARATVEIFPQSVERAVAALSRWRPGNEPADGVFRPQNAESVSEGSAAEAAAGSPSSTLPVVAAATLLRNLARGGVEAAEPAREPPARSSRSKRPRAPRRPRKPRGGASSGESSDEGDGPAAGLFGGEEARLARAQSEYVRETQRMTLGLISSELGTCIEALLEDGAHLPSSTHLQLIEALSDLLPEEDVASAARIALYLTASLEKALRKHGGSGDVPALISPLLAALDGGVAKWHVRLSADAAAGRTVSIDGRLAARLSLEGPACAVPERQVILRCLAKMRQTFRQLLGGSKNGVDHPAVRALCAQRVLRLTEAALVMHEARPLDEIVPALISELRSGSGEMLATIGTRLGELYSSDGAEGRPLLEDLTAAAMAWAVSKFSDERSLDQGFDAELQHDMLAALASRAGPCSIIAFGAESMEYLLAVVAHLFASSKLVERSERELAGEVFDTLAASIASSAAASTQRLRMLLRSGVRMCHETLRRARTYREVVAPLLLLRALGEKFAPVQDQVPDAAVLQLRASLALCLMQPAAKQSSAFAALVHPQKTVRAAGFRAIRALVAEQHAEFAAVDAEALQRVLLPVCMQAILQTGEAFSENLAADAADCLAAACGVVEWRALLRLFTSLVRLMSSHAPQERLLVGVICRLAKDSVSAQFERAEGEARSRMEKDVAGPLLRLLGTVSVQEKTIGGPGANGGVVIDKKASRFGSGNTHRKKARVVRPQIIAAMLSVARVLPHAQFRAMVPSLMEKIAACLNSRLLESRRRGRVALYRIVSAVGPEQLPPVLDQLRSRLRRGYQIAVLLYSLSGALATLVFGDSTARFAIGPVKIPVGSLDNVVPGTLALLEDELTRFADPERPEIELAKNTVNNVLARRSTLVEGEKQCGRAIVFALSRVASPDTFERVILPHLLGYLTGASVSARQRATSVTDAFGRRYRDLVAGLLAHATQGFALNSGQATFGAQLAVQIGVARKLLLLREVLLAGVRRPGTSCMHVVPNLGTLEGRDEGDVKFVSGALTSKGVEEGAEETVDAETGRGARFTVQPGAAAGRAVEASSRGPGSVDATLRAAIVSRAGLALLASLTRQLRALFSPDGRELMTGAAPHLMHAEVREALEKTAPFVINAFCGCDEAAAFQSCAKVMLLFAHLRVAAVVEYGSHVALRVLNAVHATATGGGDEGRAHLAVCMRLLAELLLRPEAAEWFDRVLGDGERSLRLALLVQVRASLEDARVQDSAVYLLRNVLLRQKRELLFETPELASNTFRCIEEVGRLILRPLTPRKLIVQSIRCYVEFVLKFPNTANNRDKYVAFALKHLASEAQETRHAALALVHEFIARLPLEVIRARYAAVIVLGLISRFALEAHSPLLDVVRVNLEVLFERLAEFDSTERETLVGLARDAFVPPVAAQPAHRAAFAAFIETLVVLDRRTGSLDKTAGALLELLARAFLCDAAPLDCAKRVPDFVAAGGDFFSGGDSTRIEIAVLRAVGQFCSGPEVHRCLVRDRGGNAGAANRICREFVRYAMVRVSDARAPVKAVETASTVLRHAVRAMLAVHASGTAEAFEWVLDRRALPEAAVSLQAASASSRVAVAPLAAAAMGLANFLCSEAAEEVGAGAAAADALVAACAAMAGVPAFEAACDSCDGHDIDHGGDGGAGEGKGGADDGEADGSECLDLERSSVFSSVAADPVGAKDRSKQEETASTDCESSAGEAETAQTGNGAEEDSDEEVKGKWSQAAAAALEPGGEEEPDVLAHLPVLEAREDDALPGVWAAEKSGALEGAGRCGDSAADAGGGSGDPLFAAAAALAASLPLPALLQRLRRCRVERIFGMLLLEARRALGAPQRRCQRANLILRAATRVALAFPAALFCDLVPGSPLHVLVRTLHATVATARGVKTGEHTPKALLADRAQTAQRLAALSVGGTAALRAMLGDLARFLLDCLAERAEELGVRREFQLGVAAVEKEYNRAHQDRRVARLRLQALNPEKAAVLRQARAKQRKKHRQCAKQRQKALAAMYR